MELIRHEIFTQNDSLIKTKEQLYRQKDELTKLLHSSYKSLIFMGCGSGYMLSRGAAAMFSVHTDKKAVALAGGAVMLHPEKYKNLFEDSLVVITSRSGETSEVAYSLSEMKKITSFKVLGILSKEECTLRPMTDLSVLLPWTYDNSVCQTRNISNFYYSLSMLLSFYNGDEALADSFSAYLEVQSEFIEKLEADCKNLASLGWNSVTVLADGEVCGVASEGGLAFTEIAILPGDYSNILDYRHGPIVLVNEKKLMIVLLNKKTDAHQKKLIADLKVRNGYVITLGLEDREFWGSDYHINLDYLDRFEAWGLPYINLCQVLAFSKAVAMGHDPDAPEGLNPFVKF